MNMNFFTRKVPEDCVFLPIFMDIQQLISYRKMKKILRRRKSWIFSVRISVENLGDLVLIRKNTKKNMENPVSFSLWQSDMGCIWTASRSIFQQPLLLMSVTRQWRLSWKIYLIFKESVSERNLWENIRTVNIFHPFLDTPERSLRKSTTSWAKNSRNRILWQIL